ncbi:hypothetical protein B0T16DRAFT_188611 [Cercophora newfieldiana]|uniref:Secreted protein n=1 Tax=Cercophora newfieldiana TaxID=92897 RepID=A0AA40CLV3_9PEZI|nr:hypothetical protein B0T16DRAFT_188611 [Cercophora newfieldiana]
MLTANHLTCLLSFIALSTLATAAGCDNKQGDIKLVKWNVNDACNAMRASKDHSASVWGAPMICEGSSTDKSYRFCNIGLENIFHDCSGKTKHGWFDYSWDGVTERYVCTGVSDGNDVGPCKPKGGKKPGLPTCL